MKKAIKYTELKESKIATSKATIKERGEYRTPEMDLYYDHGNAVTPLIIELPSMVAPYGFKVSPGRKNANLTLEFTQGHAEHDEARAVLDRVYNTLAQYLDMEKENMQVSKFDINRPHETLKQIAWIHNDQQTGASSLRLTVKVLYGTITNVDGKPVAWNELYDTQLKLKPTICFRSMQASNGKIYIQAHLQKAIIEETGELLPPLSIPLGTLLRLDGTLEDFRNTVDQESTGSSMVDV
jgi:hypothetical protein